ncbi:MAG: hypothetical protein GC206_12890 [Alphaproteobacteria bacterium]|nr:hypothetical protein [Alphaproteobacteria bacterium]
MKRLIAPALGLLAACAVPLQRTPVATPVPEAHIARVTLDARLGSPLFEWRTHRVAVYEAGPAARVMFLFLWPYGGAVEQRDTEHEVILVQFDAHDRVLRAARRERPLAPRLYRAMIEAWLADEREPR